MGPGMCGAAPDRFAPESCFPAVSCPGQVPGTQQAQHGLRPSSIDRVRPAMSPCLTRLPRHDGTSNITLSLSLFLSTANTALSSSYIPISWSRWACTPTHFFTLEGKAIINALASGLPLLRPSVYL